MRTTFGQMNDDDRKLFLHISQDEQMGIPKLDEALRIVIPVARRCHLLLASAEPDLTRFSASIHFFKTVDCARQVVERQVRVGPVNVEALVAQIDLPAIAETLPIILEGFERCRSIWAPPTHLNYTLILLIRIASHMYPVVEDGSIFSITGYGDLFDAVL